MTWLGPEEYGCDMCGDIHQGTAPFKMLRSRSQRRQQKVMFSESQRGYIGTKYVHYCCAECHEAGEVSAAVGETEAEKMIREAKYDGGQMKSSRGMKVQKQDAQEALAQLRAKYGSARTP